MMATYFDKRFQKKLGRYLVEQKLFQHGIDFSDNGFYNFKFIQKNIHSLKQ